jgi:iron-sulfur cluster assembly protein
MATAAPASNLDGVPLAAAPADAPVSVTVRALERARGAAEAEGVDLAAAVLRVAVVPGGCSGLTYDLGWDTATTDADELVDVGEGDGRIRLALDPRSAAYVEGTTLDFTDGLDGQGFHFHNPQASRTCACGESFSL